MDDQFVVVGNARLWTTRQGSGRPVVLIHGGPGACDYLSPLAELIEGISTVYRYEQRGCGQSEARPPYDVSTAIKDLDALRECFGLERWIVCGHSWGVCIAIAYALEYGEYVEGLVLLSGTGISIDWMKEYHREKAGRRPEMTPDFKYPLNKEVSELSWKDWKEYVRKPQVKKKASQLHKPVLIINGADDLRPCWPAREFAERLPRASMHLLDGVEHYLWMSETTRLKKLMHAFINGIPGLNV